MTTDPRDPRLAPNTGPGADPAPAAGAPYEAQPYDAQPARDPLPPRGGAPGPEATRHDAPRAEATRTSTHPADAPRRQSPGELAVDPEETRPGRTAAAWIALIAGAIVLILLLIFVLQNNVPTQFHYLGMDFTLPLGVAMLLSAIAGALIMALVGSMRMIQMAWTIRRLRKAQEKMLRAGSR